MEEIFTFLEDITKRLSRPIKDLDDIRHAMASLKEIRDREIMIDMSIGPIEVSALMSLVCKIPIAKMNGKKNKLFFYKLLNRILVTNTK